MLVTLGSSAPKVKARWLIAAFEAPYAPHPVYALIAAPEEVKMMRPLDLRSAGNAAVTYNARH